MTNGCSNQQRPADCFGRIRMMFLIAAMAAGASAQGFTVLYTFSGGADGGYPQYGRLVADDSGNLYGTVPFGGDVQCPIVTYPGPGCGVVFKLDRAGKETVLYTFTGGADGGQPWGGLIRGPSGNIYGTTVFGGDLGSGVIFKLDLSAHQTVLHSFGGSDGANPSGDLLQDNSGTLYGTTITGGRMKECRGAGCGVIFKQSLSGEFEVLHLFSGLANPTHRLTLDRAGNLFGATENGGLANCDNYEAAEAVVTNVPGCGGVFRLGPGGNYTQLYLFGASPDGSDSRSPVIQDQEGNIYGTTFYGGEFSNGTVFKIAPGGVETVLYSFQGSPDGANPWGGLAMDRAGNLYGMANHGGGACWCGTVFKLDSQGNYSVLHTFDYSDGAWPESSLLLHNGALYGMTSNGGTLSNGSSGTGTVFRISLQ